MSLRYIIDGYNVLKHEAFGGKGKRSDDPCVSLARCIRLNHLTGSSNNEVIMVFDGYRPSCANVADDAGITVVFSCDESADERIRRIIEREPNPKVLVVVTDDNEIRFFARAAGCAVQHVEEFLHSSTGGKKKGGRAAPDADSSKSDLNYSQMDAINKELRSRWCGGENK
jgi:predicted RNA-binding protein with PIN domain